MRQIRLTGFRNAGMYAAVLMLGLAMPSAQLMAQDQPAANTASTADSQTDANVVAALGTSKSLANVAITTDTVNGVVTLTGVVRDEGQKELAENLTAHAAGVTKVVNKLTVSTSAGNGVQGAPSTPSGDIPQTAVLLSDGTMSDGSTPDTNTTTAAQPQAPPMNNGGGQPSVAGAPPDQNGGPQQYPNGQNPNGPVMNRAPYSGPNGQYPPQGGNYGPNGQNYSQQQPPRPPRPPQVAGKQVTVQQGMLLRVRTMEPLDARNVKAGTTFNAVVLNDIMAGGAVAIPRGANIQGTVTEAKKAGAFGGSGKLVITLNTVSMGGQSYPLASDAWSNLGPNKTGQTVGNAVGLGLMGALIGAAVDRGPGAAIGGAVGAASGVAASGASPTRQAYIPAEAVLLFHLQKPLAVTTVSQDEMDRLAENVPPVNQQPRVVRRGYYGGYPPPPPAYYGGYYRY